MRYIDNQSPLSSHQNQIRTRNQFKERGKVVSYVKAKVLHICAQSFLKFISAIWVKDLRPAKSCVALKIMPPRGLHA